MAGAARAHAGLDQADPRRPAVAAAADPRSLGAARAGHGDAGGGLFRRRRRAHAADRRGVRLERRAGAGQRPGRCLGDAAGLYRQAAGHPVAANRDAASPDSGRRCRCRRAARCWCAPAAAPSTSWSAAASPRSRRASRRRRAPTNGISRSPATAPRMSARRPASRCGGSPPRPTVRRPFRWPRIRNARPAARCRCPTSSRTITASPKRARNSPPATRMRPRTAGKDGSKDADKARAAAAVRARRSLRWCCRTRAPATASARR